MWCFVDESWQSGKTEEVGVLASVFGPQSEFSELDRELFRLRRKYYGVEHAKDLRRELKGSDLFSNASFKYQKSGYSKNLSLARELLEWTATREIKLVGITVYGNTRPPLLAPHSKLLTQPFRELCIRLLAYSAEHKPSHLIFDQRIGVQEEISIAVCHYLAGIHGPRRMIPHPFIGVSNVWPGLQLADIVAHILGRYAIGDTRFDAWYRSISKLRMEGKTHRGDHVFGLDRLQWTGADQYEFRKLRQKK